MKPYNVVKPDRQNLGKNNNTILQEEGKVSLYSVSISLHMAERASR